MPELAAHPAATELAAFLAGRLPTARQQAIERHIGECAECCRTLEALPEDTLAERLRGGAGLTQGGASAGRRVRDPTQLPIPVELQEHPRYRVLRAIGLGGMGVVYLAEHRLMERQVALKVIHPELLTNRDAVRRFHSEVKAAARLGHPNIVQAFDADQSGELHFLVMEYVEGVSLAKLVADRGPLPYPYACNYIRQAALGLQHASEKGMVHRDIKPQNLMLTPAGQVKILDFGLAQLAHDGVQLENSGGTTSLRLSGTLFTHADSVFGTPDYIAPEQAVSARDVDIRADIYSLGCTFYFLLKGEAPYPLGSVDEKLAAHRTAPPPSPAGLREPLPPGLANVVERMTAKRPEDRHPTPAMVAQTLIPFLKPQVREAVAPPPVAAVVAPPVIPLLPTIVARSGVVRPVVKPRRRTSPQLWFAGVVVMLLAGGSLWLALHGGDRSGDDDNSRDVTGAAVVAKHAGASPAIATTVPSRKPTLLVILAPQYTYDDYHKVRDLLERKAGVIVRVVSTGPCRPIDMPQAAPLKPDLLLPAQVPKVADFDALYLPGGYIQIYKDNTPARSIVWQLIDDTLTAGKPVAALDLGQGVLAFKGTLRDKRVAASQFIARLMPGYAGTLSTSPVEVDGLIITGASADGADLFTLRLVEQMKLRAVGARKP